jgi:PAS domain S-box-containing protein
LEEKNKVNYFFDQADVFMIVISNDEKVVDVNLKASQILSLTKSEILGKNWFDSFVPASSRVAARSLFHNMLDGALRHVHSEHSIKTKSGKELTLNFHNILVSDNMGNTIGVLSSAEDVTERKRKEIARKAIENRLQISLDYMIEGCQIIDYDWRYQYVNEAAAKQGRKTKLELTGFTMMQVYPGIDKTEMFSLLRNCMINRVSHHFDNEFTFADGSKEWFNLHMEPVPEGILILSIDITKTKQTEAEINNYRHRLEQVVAERTAECAKAHQDLDKEIRKRQKIEEGLSLKTSILDNSKEAILLVNIKGDFVYANAAAVKAYGYSIEEFINMNIRSLMPEGDAPSVEQFLKRVVEKGATNFEMVHLKKNKTKMRVKLYSNIVKTLRGQFILVIIQETCD